MDVEKLVYRVFFGAILAAIAVATVGSLPDIKRYLYIRSL